MAATPDKKVDYDTEWPKVVTGFNRILNAIETGKGITQPEWMQLYKYVFVELSSHVLVLMLFAALCSSSRLVNTRSACSLRSQGFSRSSSAAKLRCVSQLVY